VGRRGATTSNDCVRPYSCLAMADIARALLLPDLAAPSDTLLKTLALYWDDIVVFDYVDRGFGDGDPIRLSAVGETLVNEGIVIRQERAADLSTIYDRDIPSDGVRVRAGLPSDVQRAVKSALARLNDGEAFPHHEGMPVLISPDEDGALHKFTFWAGSHNVEALVSTSTATSLFVWVSANHYLLRAADALALARSNHYAPVASSVLGHIGSLLGAHEEGAPLEEASLLSAAVSSFDLDPQTSVEDIIAFRQKHHASLGRFRASMADLKDRLQAGGTPQTKLASARDTYRNRVEPALASLEDGLKESRLKFVLKSVVGASVIALGPVSPASALVGGARLTGQTIKYGYSQHRLLEEHPFGYLHKVSSAFGAGAGGQSNRLLEPVQGNYAEVVQRLLMSEFDPVSVVEQFIGSTRPRS
jgi:hypothetical protein